MKEEFAVREQQYKKLWGDEGGSTATFHQQSNAETEFRENYSGLGLEKEKWAIYDPSSATMDLPISVVGLGGNPRLQWKLSRTEEVYTWFSQFHGLTAIDNEGINKLDEFELTYLFPQQWDNPDNATTSIVFGLAPGSHLYTNPDIKNLAQELLRDSLHEMYEVGMDNDFTIKFELSIRNYANEFLKEFKSHDSKFSVESLLAVIEVLGRIQHETTKSYRIWLLISYMSHPMAIIRDAASMALVDLAGKLSERFIRIAVALEKNESLKADMELLLNDLKEL